jgi:hypothetical protein
MFGFSPTRQIDTTVAELIKRVGKDKSRELAAAEDRSNR